MYGPKVKLPALKVIKLTPEFESINENYRIAYQRIFLVITNEKFNRTRQGQDKKLPDIDAVMDDATRVHSGLKDLFGADDKEIIHIKNQNKAHLDANLGVDGLVE